jgi:hypothetical protein
MDRDKGFPPHIIGFMRRKREKEKPASEKPANAMPFGDDSERSVANA